MKKKVLSSIILLSSCSFAYEDWIHRAPGEHDIILESSLVKLVDGLSFGIDGRKIAMMFRVRKAVRKIQHGISNEQGVFTGLYEFKGDTYGVHELAYIEQQAKLRSDIETIDELKQVLILAKKDFLNKVKPYMATARGAKKPMFMLIKESCKKRNRSDSILLRWGAAREEDEERQFEHDIVGFGIFDVFCTDLMNFMEDVIRSCPKALEQFKHMIAHEAHKQV